MARACSLNRHGEALARAPGRHARPHPGPRPLRLVLGLLVVVALVLAATLMPAVALAEEGDGGAESSDTSGTAGTEGTEGTAGAEDSVGLANDEDPGVSAGVSTGGPRILRAQPLARGTQARRSTKVFHRVRRLPRTAATPTVPTRPASPTWTSFAAQAQAQPQGQVATPGRLASTSPTSELTPRVWLPSWRRRPELARGGAPPVRERFSIRLREQIDLDA
jgi:hypothetical protein